MEEDENPDHTIAVDDRPRALLADRCTRPAPLAGRLAAVDPVSGCGSGHGGSLGPREGNPFSAGTAAWIQGACIAKASTTRPCAPVRHDAGHNAIPVLPRPSAQPCRSRGMNRHVT